VRVDALPDGRYGVAVRLREGDPPDGPA